MNSQQVQFLNLKTMPARIKVEEVAWYLGFATHEITILMAEGLLKPLGRPPSTGTKYFLSSALEEFAVTRSGSPALPTVSCITGKRATKRKRRSVRRFAMCFAGKLSRGLRRR